MVVRIADQAGFCFGVKRALQLINRLNHEGRGIQVYGELIHNRTALGELESRGIKCIENLSELDSEKTLVIRTHGIPVTEENNLKNRQVNYLDATCPLVKKTHRIIAELKSRKIRTVIVGDRNHPEIIAASSYADSPVIVNSVREAEAMDSASRMGVVAQTTLDLEFFQQIVAVLVEKAENLEVYNTVCDATRVRQNAIKKLAPQVDFVIVIGGRNSSNTKKLVQISQKKNTNTFHLERSQDLQDPDFQKQIKGFKSVGITAGASTPPEEIVRVKNFFEVI